MMAALATLHQNFLVGEGAKEKKTLADIDKILSLLTTFTTNRLPNQVVVVFGTVDTMSQFPSNGYTYTNDQADAEYLVKLVQVLLVMMVLLHTPTFTSFDNTTDAPKWASCFGTINPDALIPEVSAGSPAAISTEESPSNYYSNGDLTTGKGAEKFLDGFGGEAIKSPFGDGHYIYTVIAGSGSGSQSIAPIMFVADRKSIVFRKKF